MKACQRLEVSGRSDRGRGRKTWRECVAEDMKVLGLEERDVQDRLKWRRGILGKPSDPCKHGINRRNMNNIARDRTWCLRIVSPVSYALSSTLNA